MELNETLQFAVDKIVPSSKICVWWLVTLCLHVQSQKMFWSPLLLWLLINSGLIFTFEIADKHSLMTQSCAFWVLTEHIELLLPAQPGKSKWSSALMTYPEVPWSRLLQLRRYNWKCLFPEISPSCKENLFFSIKTWITSDGGCCCYSRLWATKCNSSLAFSSLHCEWVLNIFENYFIIYFNEI